MAVHLPLYESSQLESKSLMRPSYNLISPSNGDVILKPTQDMVIGCYYLTLMIKNHSFFLKKWFPNEDEALSAFYQKKIELHSPILVRYVLFHIQIEVENGKLFYHNSKNDFQLNKKEIFIKKIFPLFSYSKKKYITLTNIGIFILEENAKKKFTFTDLFFETSPGRLLFMMNIKNALKTDLW
jgi:DNA-directed RNA polymerase beta' subunit